MQSDGPVTPNTLPRMWSVSIKKLLSFDHHQLRIFQLWHGRVDNSIHACWWHDKWGRLMGLLVGWPTLYTEPSFNCPYLCVVIQTHHEEKLGFPPLIWLTYLKDTSIIKILLIFKKVALNTPLVTTWPITFLRRNAFDLPEACRLLYNNPQQTQCRWLLSNAVLYFTYKCVMLMRVIKRGISTEVREIKLNFTMNEKYFLSLYGV